MKNYLLTLLIAALITTIISILSPSGERGGIGKHMRLLTSLFLVCVLISPLGELLSGLSAILDGTVELPGLEEDRGDYEDILNGALDEASTAYITQMLTQMLESEFSLRTGDVRCVIKWESVSEALRPTQVTVILSGRAIWSDPRAIEQFVAELLSCPCNTAIE